MGTNFTIGLLAGLKDEAGKPVGPKFRATLKTPPFDISDLKNGVSEPKAAPALPEVRIAFNREVKLEGSEKLFRFVDEAGKSVAATVRYATQRDYYSIAPEAEDWDQRWRRGQEAGAATEAEETEEAEEAPNEEPMRNRLLVKPVSPLTPGRVWRFEMKAGIEALSGNYRIANLRTIALGYVQPFTLKSLVTSSYLNNGRNVTVTFSDELAPDVDDDTAAKFFRITPEVKNLKFIPDYQGLTMRGDFDRETEYRFEIDASLLSSDGLPVSGERSRTFRFEPVKPRIFLPQITGTQILGGRLNFPVLSTNLKTLHVGAGIVPPDKAAHALEAFEKYNKQYDPNAPDEVFQPVNGIDVSQIAKRTLTPPDVTVDARQETTLDWNELLGERKAGLIFLTVEGEPLEAIGGKRPGAQALIQLTDLGVLWKKVADQLNVTVFSMATGKPVSGAQVSLLDEKQAPISNGQSDAAGNLSLSSGAKPAWLIARHGDDQHTMRMGYGRELPMAAFGNAIDYDDWERDESTGPPLRALIFTDRPLYRPGEIVHVKGIVRYLGANGLDVESGREGKLTVFNRTIAARTRSSSRPMNAAPSKRRSSSIPRPPVTTECVCSFEGRERDSSQGGFGTGFQVADFQPNAFELNVAAPARFAPDAEIGAEVSARYFFGSSLGKSSVRWTLQYSPEEFTPDGFVGLTFGAAERPEQKALTLHDEGTLSETGTFSIRPKLPAAQDRPYRGLFTVEVTDLNQQTVSESRAFTRDASDFYLGLKMPEEYVIGHAQEIVARAVAVRPDGEALTEPVEVKAELVACATKRCACKAPGMPLLSTPRRVRKSRKQRQGGRWSQRAAAGIGNCPGARPRASSRKRQAAICCVSLQRIRPGGRRLRASGSMYPAPMRSRGIIATRHRSISSRTNRNIRSAKKARILVKTPISGEALITIERGSAFCARNACNSPETRQPSTCRLKPAIRRTFSFR
jgi:hypothetical protein